MTAPLELPKLVLGTMTFGDTVDISGAGSMLDAALGAGISHIDTANGYAGGESERMLAKLLHGRRDSVTLATKAGMPHPDAGDNSPLSTEGLRASVEGSLRRLDTDYVDLFYLHQPDRTVTLTETLTTVAELVAEGKIRTLGVSNFAAWQISEINYTADTVGAPRPIVAQQLYNLLARRMEEEYAEFADVTGLTTMVYNPLGGGLLTGRHTFEESPADGRFGDFTSCVDVQGAILEHTDLRRHCTTDGDRGTVGHLPDRACVALAGQQARRRIAAPRRIQSNAPRIQYRGHRARSTRRLDRRRV